MDTPGQSVNDTPADDAQDTPVVQGAASQHPVQPVTPAAAEDLDLIEKEWVYKAKEIVEATQASPHEQSAQINQIKADYIKKRYDKDIQVDQ